MMQCLFACTAFWDSWFIARQTLSVQYPLTWCFFFHTLIFLLACFTFIFILSALSLSFAPSSRIVTKISSFGVYVYASNTTRRLGNQASLGISFGLFFLYLLMKQLGVTFKVADGIPRGSWLLMTTLFEVENCCTCISSKGCGV